MGVFGVEGEVHGIAGVAFIDLKKYPRQNKVIAGINSLGRYVIVCRHVTQEVQGAGCVLCEYGWKQRKGKCTCQRG
jgi:hypothetical protein